MLTDTSPVSWFTSIDSDWATSEVDWLKSPLEDSVVTWLKAAKDSSAVKFTPSFSALSTGSTKALLKFWIALLSKPKACSALARSWRMVSSACRMKPPAGPSAEPPSAADRKRVVSGKSVSVSVDLGGRRYIKKKN